MPFRSAALAFTIAALATSALAQEAPRTDDEIKALVLEAIRENPGIIEEAVQLLREQEEERQMAAARELLADRSYIEEGAPVLANEAGDVTVVEFLDYNCPYCKRAMDEVDALVAADPNVRVVVREWPILGEGSVIAARAALAAREQGRYEDMHQALMNLSRSDEASVMAAAERLGLDMAKLTEDMNDPAINAHFDRSHELAQAMGFSGTPSFIIGEELLPGVVAADGMKAFVEAERARSAAAPSTEVR